VIILLTNDDGIYAPGLAAMAHQLSDMGELYVVAPASEQSGVSQSITFLTPLIVKEVYHGKKRWGWAVEGTPADCVKLGITELCPKKPDLIISGINGGLNAGINVLYSGTVAAAIEGAFFGITSMAVSLEFDERADFDRAASLAKTVLIQLLRQKEEQEDATKLYNLNIPISALEGQPKVQTVGMDLTRYSDKYERRGDPWGRDYYWMTGNPPTSTGGQTDLSAVSSGDIALSPLEFDMTAYQQLNKMRSWQFDLSDIDQDTAGPRPPATATTVRGLRKMQQICIDETDDKADNNSNDKS
jgi:5'/3'-nucleotidase